LQTAPLLKPFANKPIISLPIGQFFILMKGCDKMDFLRINNEFQNLQKKLEDSERYIKGINNYLKKLDKEIIRLEQKRDMEKDVINSSVDNLIIEIKKQFKKSLEEIININNKE